MWIGIRKYRYDIFTVLMVCAISDANIALKQAFVDHSYMYDAVEQVYIYDIMRKSMCLSKPSYIVGG